MDVKWLILATGRTHGVGAWADAVAATGRAGRVVAHLPLDAGEVYGDRDRVVVNGAAADVARIAHARGWHASAALGDAEAFACHAWLAAWGDDALQQAYAFATIGEVTRDRDRWIAALGDASGRLFVRPDAHDKSFDGGLRDGGELAAWGSQLAVGLGNATRPCLVARPRAIDAEWRLFVGPGGRIVAGSSYLVAGRLDRSVSPPADVVALAERLAAMPYPRLPAAYAIDICRSDGRPWLVEVGSALSSAPYAADLRAIVDAVSDAAASCRESG